LNVRPGQPDRHVQSRGNEFLNRVVHLEVVENERLVFTDAYTEAWQPSQKPFMTLIVTFENEDGKTHTPRWCAIGRPRSPREDGHLRRLRPGSGPARGRRRETLTLEMHSLAVLA
jgi:uncharacterized protein YndB with AHSA1/START domain